MTTPEPQPLPQHPQQQQPAPLMWQGQPWSAEGAAARRSELMADKDYAKAAQDGDAVKLSELKDLWLLSRGIVPGSLQKVETSDDVRVQMDVREQERQDQATNGWRARVAPQTPAEIAQFERGDATKSEKEAARRNIARHMNDPAFRTKLIAKDVEANMYWSRWHWAAYKAREVPDPKPE